MASNTPNYNFIKPGVNDPTDQDLWGGYLNSNLDSQDSLIKTATDNISRSLTSNDSIGVSDRNKIILIDATSSNLSMSLDDASTVEDGFTVYVKKTDSTTNTITITSPDTIDGAVNLVLSKQNQGAELISDGTKWYVAASHQTPDTVTLSKNGYIIHPSGLIDQWGRLENVTLTESVTVPVVFNIPFVTECYNIQATVCLTAVIDGGIVPLVVKGTITTTGFTFIGDNTLGNISVTGDVFWRALGK